MKRYKQFEPLIIEDFEATEWLHPMHQHNHYELICIRKGWGTHIIQENPIPYQEGDIFLIGPDEAHAFEIAELTRFVFIKFRDVYIQQTDTNQQAGIGTSFGLQHLEYLIKSRETHLSGFHLSPGDQCTADAIIQVILSLKQEILSNEPLIWLQVLALAVLLHRNMPELRTTISRSRDMQAIFCYLHKYIYTPEKLRSPVVAAHFNTAPDYIGPYFKRNTGFTLREYIGSYRKTLIRHRMDSGNYSLKQIALEFGLTDESHVSKIMN
jgi:AraC family L-rhamnose operon regulatory protein RhaS